MTTDKAIVIIPPQEEMVSHARDRIIHIREAVGTLVDTFEEGKGKDFWKIPGTPTKSLLQRGASKIITYLGLREEFHEIRQVEKWDGKDPMFYYLLECRLYDIRSGQEIGRSLGSCSTKEPKYYKKKDGTLQDPFGNQHTVLLMARKRALVSVARRVAVIEGEFTQDMEDFYVSNGSQGQVETAVFDPSTTRIKGPIQVTWLVNQTQRPAAEIATILQISKWSEWNGTVIEAYNAVMLSKTEDVPSEEPPVEEAEVVEGTPLSDPENVAALKELIGGDMPDDLLLSFLGVETYEAFTGTVEEAHVVIADAVSVGGAEPKEVEETQPAPEPTPEPAKKKKAPRAKTDIDAIPE